MLAGDDSYILVAGLRNDARPKKPSHLTMLRQGFAPIERSGYV